MSLLDKLACVQRSAESEAYARVGDYAKSNKHAALARRHAFGAPEVIVLSSDLDSDSEVEYESEPESEREHISGPEGALRARSKHTGRLEDGMRMELDVELPGGSKQTYTYKLRPLFAGGNNAVYAARVAKLERLVDVDAETLLRAARAKAKEGAAKAMSKESVAVIVHDLLDAAYGGIAALDIASAILERGQLAGETLCDLAKTSNAVRDELQRGSYCSTQVAEFLGEHLSDLFSDEDALVEVSASKGRPPEEPTHVWIDDLVVRMKIRSVARDDRAGINDYWGEVRQSRRVSDAGLAPKVYARMLLAVGNGKRVHPCVVLERFEASLREVQLCPSLIRRVFVESDGEASLVDLYARASGYMRCIDTKPGNVVVRLPKPMGALKVQGGTKAARRATRDRMLPQMALIDVDPRFCGEPSALVGRKVRVAGASTVADLENALAKFIADDDTSEAYGSSPLLAAAMSLLIHCAVGAGHIECGYPYIAITRVLLARWEAIERLVQLDKDDDDRHAMVPGRGRKRVIEQLRHYTKQHAKADNPLEHVRGILTRALAEPETNVLALCSGQGSSYGDPPESVLVDPAMYEYAALLLMKGDRNLLTSLKYVSLLSELQYAVESLSKSNSYRGVRPECWLEPSGSCDLHYHADDSASVERGLQLPDIVDRPLLTRRESSLIVRAAVDAESARALKSARRAASYPGERGSAAVATLLHDLVVGKFGAAVAAGVARAVLDSAAEWSAERLQNLARGGVALAFELRRMHVTESVAWYIAESVAGKSYDAMVAIAAGRNDGDLLL
jgi:hypothetical protein